MSRLATTALLLGLCLTLAGCGDKLLERSYSSVVPHNAAYWENEDADTLRAENYQDLVNALLLLLGEHSDDGVVRIYGDAADKAELAERACVEVQKETPIGAYLLDYITYDGEQESGWYELTVRFGYAARRRSRRPSSTPPAPRRCLICCVPPLRRGATRLRSASGISAPTARASWRW